MILLIWDSFGADELRFYEFDEGTEGQRLAEECHTYFVYGTHVGDVIDEALDKLSTLLNTTKLRPIGQDNFGPYSAIYVSGFIP